MRSEEVLFRIYPAFQPLFEGVNGVSVPLYLTLLSLGDGCKTALTQVRRILDAKANLTPHLVGAVAMGLGAASEPSRAALPG